MDSEGLHPPWLLAAIHLAQPGSMHAYVLLCLSLSVQGVCDGIMNGPLVALMDDSCPAGRRSDVETANSVIFSVAASVGPLLGLVVFLFAGNDWSLPSMKAVTGVGVVLQQLAIFPSWRMDDRRALGEHSEAVHLQQRLQEPGAARELVARNTRSTCCGLVTAERVRYVLFVGELVMALGAGMTVKFFPVFFSQEGHVNPAVLQAVFASLAGLTCIGTLLSSVAAKRVGRFQVIIPNFVIGISCTVLLGLLRPFYTVPGVMLPIFVCRCTMQWRTFKKTSNNKFKAGSTFPWRFWRVFGFRWNCGSADGPMSGKAPPGGRSSSVVGHSGGVCPLA